MSKFSVILPLRNGGNYLKECVESILSQTYKNFELLILENCSTDGGMEWLQLQKDERIRILPAAEPLSIEQNWGRIKDVKKSEFITLIGHDDILHPDYLAVMDRLISKYPDASLYLAHFNYINSSGGIIRPCKPMQQKQAPAEMLSNCLGNKMDITGTGFVMRSKDYDAVGGIPLYPSLLFADFELWINLAEKKYMAVAPECTFAFRIHQSTTTSSSDKILLKGFKQFIDFLCQLKTEDESLGKVIVANTNSLLNFYCQGLTSRLLRTAIAKRDGQSVKMLIDKFRGFAKRLNPTGTFKPMNNLIVGMALFIDSNVVTRNAFLLFKKIYTKPIYKN